MLSSWGNYTNGQPAHIIDMLWRDTPIPFAQHASFLPYGRGRSYGDSCLNEQGVLITTQHLNHLIQFDPVTGILECEAGITLTEILNFIVPRGWFLPVLPGTQYISVGGAIANDIHGKNHQHSGTFGCHVLSLTLLRSNGDLLTCTPTNNAALYQATIGGLGLTGIILTAALQLRRIHSPYLSVTQRPLQNLDDFFRIAADSDTQFEYTVAWLDLTSHNHYGRGIFIGANHYAEDMADALSHYRSSPSQLTIPRYLPNLCNRLVMRNYNRLYYYRHSRQTAPQRIGYDRFFFPLDDIQHWNRLYGKAGFLQYQCVLPTPHMHELSTLLTLIKHSGQTPTLAVAKLFGDHASPGMLSFPMPGVTIALDLAYRGEPTLQLLTKLDAMVMQAGGRVYPAKDARMAACAFKKFFPQWHTFSQYIDAKFSSSFWQRVISDDT